ncbi:MAG: T9SS type A sorting domain-containing protein [Balneolaceae bacterium]
MIKLKSLLLLTAFALSFVGLRAQSVISFSGGTMENQNITLNFSAGEVISGSFSNSTMNLVGGFSSGSGFIPTSNEKLTDDLPKVFRLNQNYPNPFNPSTNISYDLPKAADVRLVVYNSIGAQVAVLAEGRKSAGSHVIRYDASFLASGMYFYRLTASGNVIATKKMILIK